MRRKTVLLADDDESMRIVLSGALRTLGCDVAVVEDGAEIEELVHAHRFDLLVLDLYMPGMNGFEVVRRIRQPPPGFLPARATPSEVSILVVSAESNPGSIANAKAVGANAYLTKPFDIDELQRTARDLLV